MCMICWANLKPPLPFAQVCGAWSIQTFTLFKILSHQNSLGFSFGGNSRAFMNQMETSNFPKFLFLETPISSSLLLHLKLQRIFSHFFPFIALNPCQIPQNTQQKLCLLPYICLPLSLLSASFMIIQEKPISLKHLTKKTHVLKFL